MIRMCSLGVRWLLAGEHKLLGAQHGCFGVSSVRFCVVRRCSDGYRGALKCGDGSGACQGPAAGPRDCFRGAACTLPGGPDRCRSFTGDGADGVAAASGSEGIKSGNRAAASMVTRHLKDRTAISWNPTNGNMVLAGQLLHIKGAGRDLGIGWRYNSLNDARPTLSVGASEAAVTVGADLSVTYTAPDGGTYRFAKSGPTVWTMPPGLNATITSSTSTAVSIRFNDTGYSNDYVKVGSVFRLVSENDQNAAAPNKITYTYNAAGLLTTINDTIGGRPVTFSYDDPNNPEQPSRIHDDAEVRDIWFEYNGPGGAMSEITDANGEV